MWILVKHLMASQPVPEPFGLVPDLDEVLVVLDHNVVLVELPVHVRLRSALEKQQVEKCKHVLLYLCNDRLLYSVQLLSIKTPCFLGGGEGGEGVIWTGKQIKILGLESSKTINGDI